MKTVPDGFSLHDDVVMSNLDHRIDQEVAKDIRAFNQLSYYTAWNFCGTVWWDKEWHCAVFCHHSHVDTISRPTLEEIMTECCERFGAD